MSISDNPKIVHWLQDWQNRQSSSISRHRVADAGGVLNREEGSGFLGFGFPERRLSETLKLGRAVSGRHADTACLGC